MLTIRLHFPIHSLTYQDNLLVHHPAIVLMLVVTLGNQLDGL